MATITAQMVKELRDKTGAGMMDCKKALTAADGDLTLAIENLRKAGAAKAAKKAGRAAKNGCVLSRIEGRVAVQVEMLCESEQAGKTPRFREFTEKVVNSVLTEYEGDADLSAVVAESVKEEIAGLVGVLSENLQLRRVSRWESDGTYATYTHMGGKIGVLVEAAGDADAELLRDMCMHIAAFNPRFIAPEDVPAEILDKEKEIAQAQVAGKPEHILDKIVTGKLNKWYAETCLLRQPWIRDDKKCLAKIAPKLEVKRFLRWQIGEEL